MAGWAVPTGIGPPADEGAFAAHRRDGNVGPLGDPAVNGQRRDGTGSETARHEAGDAFDQVGNALAPMQRAPRPEHAGGFAGRRGDEAPILTSVTNAQRSKRARPQAPHHVARIGLGRHPEQRGIVTGVCARAMAGRSDTTIPPKAASPAVVNERRSSLLDGIGLPSFRVLISVEEARPPASLTMAASAAPAALNGPCHGALALARLARLQQQGQVHDLGQVVAGRHERGQSTPGARGATCLAVRLAEGGRRGQGPAAAGGLDGVVAPGSSAAGSSMPVARWRCAIR